MGCDTAGITVAYQAAPTIRNCIVTGNSSPTVGGGVYVFEASAEIIDCTITGNTAYHGGGVYIEDKSNVLIRNCLISNNSASNQGGSGGGIECIRSTLMVQNCRIEGNLCYPGVDFESAGGGIISGRSVIIFQNSILGGNFADIGSEIYSANDDSFLTHNCTIVSKQRGISWRNDPPSFISSILWGNSEILVPHLYSTGNPDVTHSCIQGGYPGEGNISVDPKFRDAVHGDFRLQPDSPCIDTAATTGPPDDLDGKPRPVDIAGVGRDGTATYDMGAYEFQLDELPHPTPSQVDPGRVILYE
jgi:hypothetical protein